MKIVCPNCNSKRFYGVAHVSQGWELNDSGEFVDVVETALEVVHRPDKEDVIDCFACGEQAEVTED